MTRTRRTWGALRPEIYLLLLQTEGNEGSIGEPTLRLLWNQCKDRRQMELEDNDEGFFVRRFYTAIAPPPVNEPHLIQFPSAIDRVKRVLRIFEDGDEKALHRAERYSEGVARFFTGSRDGYLPTYRLMDDAIVLEPPADFTQADGIAIEAEAPDDLFLDDDSSLSSSWPVFAEFLLELDTAIAALDTEEYQAGSSAEIVSGLRIRRRDYEDAWYQHIAERTRGRTFASPNPGQVD